MKLKCFKLLCLAIIISLGSCVTPRDTNFLQDIEKDYPMAQNFIKSDYKIIPGDQLALTIFTLDEDMRDLFSMYVSDRPQAQSTVTVSSITDANVGKNLNVYSDGSINIPYIGKVHVEGLTLLEAKKLIEARFEKFSPNLTIELILANRYFSLLGEAGRGRYQMTRPKITIFEAFATSGQSINTFGDRSKVRIIRQTPNGTEVKIFDIRSKDILNSEYYYIQPNDVIYVQEMSRTFFGRVTSFTGVLGLFGLVTTTAAAVVFIINITK